MGLTIRRYEVWLTNLDPTVGAEIRKTRPCLLVSPDVMHRSTKTVTTAPMTTKGRVAPATVECRFQGKKARVVLEQIRSIDKTRLIRRMGRIDAVTARRCLELLREIFTDPNDTQ